MKRLLLLILLTIPCAYVLVAQGVLDQQVSAEFWEVSLEEALYRLGDEHDLRLSFSNDILPPKVITAKFEQRTIGSALGQLLQDTPLRIKELGGQIVIFLPVDLEFTINGILVDASTGERLIGANIYDNKSGKGTVTNEYGYFSITLPAGPVALDFSYVGYGTLSSDFYLMDNQRLDQQLRSDLQLEPIEVVGYKPRVDPKMVQSGGATQLNMEQLEQLPALAGESDLVRALQLLPGVQSGTDGLDGLHVRGGGNGQNLIMIDGVPVYNISHAAGLFSVFNTNAVKSAQLYKSGFPARFGGRLSSVLDIRTRDGNNQHYEAEASLGLLSGRMTLEGPIQKGKSSFIVSGRRSLIGWYLQPLAESIRSEEDRQSLVDYDFYDVNAKLNFTLSDRDDLYFSFYTGKDAYRNRSLALDTLFTQDTSVLEPVPFLSSRSALEEMTWGNTVTSMRWTHLFGDQLFASLTASYSGLDVGITYERGDSLTNARSGSVTDRYISIGRYFSQIDDFGARLDFDYRPAPVQSLRFGFFATRHLFEPGLLSLELVEKSDTLRQPRMQARAISASEFGGYLENIWQVSPEVKVNAGLHVAAFQVDGQTYSSLQPRLIANWSINNRLLLNGYLSKMTQFVHLLSNSTLGLPNDLWVPSTASVKPEQSWQFGLSSTWQFGEGWQLTGDMYTKYMSQLLTYSEGALFFNNWESNLTSGTGQAYGMELLLEKRQGKTTGWASYGLAWADRRFPLVNNGRRYPYRYDRRHSLTLAFVHVFNEWLEFSGSWAMNSGFAFSLPQGRYQVFLPGVGSINVVDYGEKNSFRMPVYHRLDFGVNLYIETERVRHTLNLGVYNLYNRRNPLYYNLETRYVTEGSEIREDRRFSPVWLLPLIPALNYSLKL
ncbi:TonB-dependent receptor [Phaeodactylibacter xiamenensis]|uniref:TonB-dependent receptor n=1 Tax=Phaeodactylibacter xiamenensis TaxID=1524460 RepID=UPI003CCC2397